MTKRSKFIFATINGFIFVTAVIAISVTLTIGSRATRLDGITEFAHWQHIATFTVLSNIFLAIMALIAAINGITASREDKAIGHPFLTWYLAATTAGLITCLTVIFFLAPMRALNGKDYFDMLLEPMFFLHFLNPILAAIGFIFLTGRTKITLRDRVLATLPIVIYAIPYAINVAILKTWPDFYGLTFGGKYFLLPLVFAGFIFLSFSIASLVTTLRSKATKYLQ